VNLLLARPGLWAVPCPLYSIANWAKGSGFVQAASMAALATAHLAGVRRVQPQGPYRLAGFSLGGLIALEMAQQLRAAGEEVELLFLLDPMEPPSSAAPTAGVAVGGRPEWEPGFGEKLARYARRLRGLAAGPRGPGFLRRWLSALLPLGRLPLVEWASYQLVHHYGRHPDSALRLLLPRNRWRAFWFAARRMVQGYVAQPYGGPVLAVFGESGRRKEVWAALLGPQADLRLLDCAHDALFEEPALGRWMAWLAEAVAARR
jgi:pimeloyl-ACP methyl ester carboxylesterase